MNALNRMTTINAAVAVAGAAIVLFFLGADHARLGGPIGPFASGLLLAAGGFAVGRAGFLSARFAGVDDTAARKLGDEVSALRAEIAELRIKELS